MGTLYADQCTLLIKSCSVLLRMRNISDKRFIENHTHILYSANCALYEIMWKNIVKPDRPQMTISGMQIACWIPLAAHTHTQNM